jgi:hypothetical protein
MVTTSERNVNKNIHYIIIKNDLNVYLTEYILNFSKKDILCIIKCEFINKTSSGMHEYYKYTACDANFNPLQKNEFEWNNISCYVNPNDKWEPVHSTSCSIAITIEIIDRNGESMEQKIDNAQHSVKAWETLVDYLRKLDLYSRHSVIKEIGYKNMEIEKLKSIIENLKKK